MIAKINPGPLITIPNHIQPLGGILADPKWRVCIAPNIILDIVTADTNTTTLLVSFLLTSHTSGQR